jgi:hypothetical protein
VEFSQKIVEMKDYKSFVDPLDLNLVASKDWGYSYPTRDTQQVTIDLASGSLLKKSAQKSPEAGEEETSTSEDQIEEAADSKLASILLPAGSFFQGTSVVRKFQPFTVDKRASESKGGE